MRYFVLFLATSLTACALPRASAPIQKTNEPVSSHVTETAATLGEFEVMPETTESLEVPVEKQLVLEVAWTEHGTIVQGNPTLPLLSIVTDLDCVYCAHFAQRFFPLIEREYMAKQRLAVEWIFLPQKKTGEEAAKIALCSTITGELFEESMNALLISNDTASIVKHTKHVKSMLEKCVKSPATLELLLKNQERSKALGISRVPGFSLNGYSWLGVATEEGLRAEIEKGLKR